MEDGFKGFSGAYILSLKIVRERIWKVVVVVMLLNQSHEDALTSAYIGETINDRSRAYYVFILRAQGSMDLELMVYKF